MVDYPINAKTRAVNPSSNSFEFGGFLSIYYYQPGGLNGTLSAYLLGKRDDFFIVNLMKILPTIRKGASFSYSVGKSLGSISLAGSPKTEPGRFLSRALFDFGYFLESIYGSSLGENAEQRYLASMRISRFWKSPFRPGYYGKWIPGAFTNYSNVIKAYSKKSAPKVVVYRYRLAKDLQSWFLPKWYPSFMGVFDMSTSSPAVREASKMCVPTISVGAIPTRSVQVDEATYPIVGMPTLSSSSIIYELVTRNYYRGAELRLIELKNKLQRLSVSSIRKLPVFEYADNQKVGDQIISRDKYLKIVSKKPSQYDYFQALRKKRREERILKRKQALLKKFEEEERKRLEKYPHLKNSKFHPTPMEKYVFFQPFFDSKGTPYGQRKDEQDRRNRILEARKKDPTIPAKEVGREGVLNYGLYIDFFTPDGYLKSGCTLWNVRVRPGEEDHVSQKYQLGFTGKNPRPDLKNPKIKHGHKPPPPLNK